MAKLSKKKSKRVTTRMRTKIEKKVKEHRRKLKREAKKNPQKFKRKDPGIPNSCPFKYEIMLAKEKEKEQRELEREKQRERQKKERAKLVAQKRNIDLGVVKNFEMMVASAEQKEKEFSEKSKLDVKEKAYAASGKSVESSVKTFYKEFRRVVEAADVVLEVLDARDPLGTRCAEVEQTVLASGGSKRLVLVLNKIDLVPQDIARKWLKHLRNEFPTVAFKASTQSQASHLAQKKIPAEGGMEYLLKSNLCLGAELLMKLLGNYCRQADIKQAIRVGVVGFPNTGKSSIINSLKRSRVCNTGAVPGVTKAMQTIQLDKHISLLDSPGVVLASGQSDVAAVLRNVVKLENLEDTVPAVEAILKRCNRTEVMLHYNIPSYRDTQTFLALLAKRCGKLRKGGVPDLNAAAKIVLKDWTSGKIAYYTHPPEQHSLPAHLSARLCEDLGREFRLEELEAEDLVITKDLKPNSTHFMAVQSTEPVRGVTSEEAVQQMEEQGNLEQEDMDISDLAHEEKEEKETEEGVPSVDVVLPARAGKEPDKMGAVQPDRKKGKNLEVKMALRALRTGKRGQSDPKVTEGVKCTTTPTNLQLGQNRQLVLKSLKKKRRRTERLAAKLSETVTTTSTLAPDVDPDGDYVFSEHFDLEK